MNNSCLANAPAYIYTGNDHVQVVDICPPKTWAVLSKDGALLEFDSPTMRKVSDYDLHAKVTAAVLDEAAKQVDHILKEGGGTYGDAIRNLQVKRMKGSH